MWETGLVCQAWASLVLSPWGARLLSLQGEEPGVELGSSEGCTSCHGTCVLLMWGTHTVPQWSHSSSGVCTLMGALSRGSQGKGLHESRVHSTSPGALLGPEQRQRWAAVPCSEGLTTLQLRSLSLRVQCYAGQQVNRDTREGGVSQ